MRLRRPGWFESNAFPTDTLHNLDKLDVSFVSKAVESAKDFLLLEFGVLMDRDFLWKPAEVRALVDLQGFGTIPIASRSMINRDSWRDPA